MMASSRPTNGTTFRWTVNGPAPLPQPVRKKPRHAYSASLTPALSPLQPHCMAKDRLELWKPAAEQRPRDENGYSLEFPTLNLARVDQVVRYAYKSSTLEVYGSGLLVYHVFCDIHEIGENQRAPASPVVIKAFLSVLAGSYSGSAIANYLYGVRAWHFVHDIPWSILPTEVENLLKGAKNLAPERSKRKKRQPYTLIFICKILSWLNPKIPLDAAVRSCLLTTFHSAARVGETTLPNQTAFDATQHVKPSNLRQIVTREGLTMTEIAVPMTKSAPNGETLQYARQNGPVDPCAAWDNHININAPPANGPMFAYRAAKGHKPLTKSAFIKRLAAAARKAGEEPLAGHGIRIGATLEYLLRGVPFETVKVIGRWSSDAFLLYLRKHAQILAPYMQAVPTLHDKYIRYTMPPVRW